jgi:uncharacterized protein (TIGR02444 family)
MSQPFPVNAFWDFSVAAYRQPPAASACLALQARYGVDVNLLLFCCWVAAAGGGRLDDGRLERAAAAVDRWQRQVVGPLRALRGRLKGGFESAPAELAAHLRGRILAVELDAEHVEQLVLAATVDRPSDDARPAARCLQDAAANLAAYFALLGGHPDDTDRRDLRAIIEACFPLQVPSDIATAAAAIRVPRP